MDLELTLLSAPKSLQLNWEAAQDSIELLSDQDAVDIAVYDEEQSFHGNEHDPDGEPTPELADDVRAGLRIDLTELRAAVHAVEISGEHRHLGCRTVTDRWVYIAGGPDGDSHSPVYYAIRRLQHAPAVLAAAGFDTP